MTTKYSGNVGAKLELRTLGQSDLSSALIEILNVKFITLRPSQPFPPLALFLSQTIIFYLQLPADIQNWNYPATTDKPTDMKGDRKFSIQSIKGKMFFSFPCWGRDKKVAVSRVLRLLRDEKIPVLFQYKNTPILWGGGGRRRVAAGLFLVQLTRLTRYPCGDESSGWLQLVLFWFVPWAELRYSLRETKRRNYKDWEYWDDELSTQYLDRVRDYFDIILRMGMSHLIFIFLDLSIPFILL